MNHLKYSFVLFSLLIINAVSNSQDIITRTPGDFHGLSIIGKMRVELYKSDTSRVEFYISNAPPESLITEVPDSILRIRLKTDTNKSAVIKIKVYYSGLNEITVANNSLLVSPEIFTAENINFTARSGAKIEMKLDVKNIKADVKQGSILVLSGKTTRQEIDVNTGATYSAYKLDAEDTYVVANAGSKAKVCASRIIDATSNTKSYVGYIGVPVSVYSKTNLGGVIAAFANEEAVFEE